jgi:hypothetical protein
MQKVGFPKPGAAVEIERIVCLAGLVGDRFGSGSRKLV